MAAFVLAAALVFVVGVAVAEAPGPTVDTAATVQPGECQPCHLTLGKVNKPGIIFDHGNHVLVSCEACHSRFPHRPGGTIESVPMETCYACHGVQHGPQGELATGECRSCHTKSFKLRPTSHTTTWAKQPHVDAAKAQGINTCMMCHEAKRDCDPCHKREDVAYNTPDVYHPVVAVNGKGPSVKIYPTNMVSMSQCVYCHSDLDKITGGRLIFSHGEHLRRNFKCESCHTSFPHNGNNGKPSTPEMQGCYRCHGLQHASQGQVAGEECGKCHPKNFKLEPNNHTKAFIGGDHKKRALSDPSYCAMCHKPQFCVDCHTGKSKSANAPRGSVMPADHTDAKWQGQHGKDFLAGKGACGACHDGPSCQKCHLTVMPHPVNWAENHRPPAGIPNSDCNICHRDRQKCQNCHHDKVKNASLVVENCVRCHEDMSQTPATGIKNKAIAEHAVHFGVAKKKGKPYKCYECHTDFGSSAAAQKVALQQGHDLRLCYGCHGALDPFNRTIAPWPGAELCRRCHSNLNI